MIASLALIGLALIIACVALAFCKRDQRDLDALEEHYDRIRSGGEK